MPVFEDGIAVVFLDGKKLEGLEEKISLRENSGTCICKDDNAGRKNVVAATGRGRRMEYNYQSRQKLVEAIRENGKGS